MNACQESESSVGNVRLQQSDEPSTWRGLHSRSRASLLAERMQWTAARKSTAPKTDFGTKTEVSHAEGAVVGRSRIERGPDLVILPTTEKQPAMEHRNEALVVGYLGFRARIFLNRCTNCAQMGRNVEPLPSPAATLRHIPFRALMRGDGRA